MSSVILYVFGIHLETEVIVAPRFVAVQRGWDWGTVAVAVAICQSMYRTQRRDASTGCG